MRKVYIHKPAGDTGEEVLHIRYGGKWHNLKILPGFRREIVHKQRGHEINCEVVIETKKLGSDGKSRYIVHTEWANMGSVRQEMLGFYASLEW